MATPLFAASGMDEQSAKLCTILLPCESVVFERLRREGSPASIFPRLERSRQGYPSSGGKWEVLNRS
ncbi:unnamed protein product [Fusarium graminearum]|nr:unnamed protein product [Fusarium graminearum]CAG1986431.1 unnamed protein product [Fusarium graminearum]VTO89657.1 unnamed protein product [Fusarium graminearum]